MRFRQTDSSTRCARQGSAGFTLAEVLAALVFMAIVIPVAIQGVKIASQTGVLAQRKGEAARVAERVLNETMVTTNWNKSLQSGQIGQGIMQYRWQVRSEPWLQEPMRLVSVQVSFSVQGQDYDVRLSTLADSSQ
jgi:type II secretory pathway pseudopilin PulG